VQSLHKAAESFSRLRAFEWLKGDNSGYTWGSLADEIEALLKKPRDMAYIDRWWGDAGLISVKEATSGEGDAGNGSLLYGLCLSAMKEKRGGKVYRDENNRCTALSCAASRFIRLHGWFD
jgi:hypothetical protein